MTKARLEEIRAADAMHTIAERRELITALDEAIAEIWRQREAYDDLANCVGGLDFDRSESAPPQTQEQWFEFIRAIDDRANELVDAEDEERATDPIGRAEAGDPS